MEYKTDEASILNALSALQRNNTLMVSEATTFLLQAMESQYNLEVFFAILCGPNPPYVGLVVRDSWIGATGLCDSDTPDGNQVLHVSRSAIQDEWYGGARWLLDVVKQLSLSLLSNEMHNAVRRAICGVISTIAIYEYRGGEWKEIRDIILNVS